MTAIVLNGASCAQHIKNSLSQRVSKYSLGSHYISIFLLSDDPASHTYVRMKKRFGDEIGLDVRIIDLSQKEKLLHQDIITQIQIYNDDIYCLGIMVQLPLPTSLQSYQTIVLSSISANKDIDGLSGVGRGQYLIGCPTTLPATPAGILLLLDHYKRGDVQGKTITVIGQSNLVGLPLVTAFVMRGATVLSVNKRTAPRSIIEYTRQSDIIISATGVPHLICSQHINSGKKQTLIDVGRSRHDGIIKGDMDFDDLVGKVEAITPVPGGVGPMTIAALFDNIRILHHHNAVI